MKNLFRVLETLVNQPEETARNLAEDQRGELDALKATLLKIREANNRSVRSVQTARVIPLRRPC
jgi:hypothetical protein